MIRHHDVDTPVGSLTVAVRGGSVVALAFADHFPRVSESVRGRFGGEDWVAGSTSASDALERYVDGELDALDALSVDFAGTDFQRRVWTTLRSIPAGETWSYGDLARAAGSPNGTRAVGAANGANPVWLVLPCHRVIRSDGSLGGYGGGLDRKAWLLAHEGATIRAPRVKSGT